MSSGHYFVLSSRLSGCVLAGNSEDGQTVAPGAKVVTANTNSTDGTQMWCYDTLTHTLRLRANENLCLDMEGQEAVLNPYHPDAEHQRWEVAADRIHLRGQSELVLDIADNNTNPMARVCIWQWHGGANQQFDQQYLGFQYFYFSSRMHGKVLDVYKERTDPGTRVIMYSRNEDLVADNQLWYEDKYGIIHSKQTDMVLDCEDEDNVRIQPYDMNNKNQGFKFHDGLVTRDADFSSGVLDIKGEDDDNKADLIIYEYTGKSNQLWDKIFV